VQPSSICPGSWPHVFPRHPHLYQCQLSFSFNIRHTSEMVLARPTELFLFLLARLANGGFFHSFLDSDPPCSPAADPFGFIGSHKIPAFQPFSSLYLKPAVNCLAPLLTASSSLMFFSPFNPGLLPHVLHHFFPHPHVVARPYYPRFI